MAGGVPSIIHDQRKTTNDKRQTSRFNGWKILMVLLNIAHKEKAEPWWLVVGGWWLVVGGG